jgi:hypothetical protein
MSNKFNRLIYDKERREPDPNEDGKSLYLSGTETERHKYVVHRTNQNQIFTDFNDKSPSAVTGIISNQVMTWHIFQNRYHMLNLT